MLTYSMDRRGEESLYEYLYACIRHDIETGSIREHEKMPSKRALAEHLGVSVITVENAYAQLSAEGYLYSIERKGYFANPISQPQERVHGNAAGRAAALSRRAGKNGRESWDEAGTLVADFTGSVMVDGLSPMAYGRKP